MVWSPIPHFPKIFGDLKSKGNMERVGRNQLADSIITNTKVYNEKTITKIIALMSRLGYIRDSGRGSIFLIYQGEPHNFPQEIEEVDKELDKYG